MLKFAVTVAGLPLFLIASMSLAAAQNSKAIEGTWQPLKIENSGKTLSKLQKYRMIFSGQKFKITNDGKVGIQGTYKLDAAKKSIEFTFTQASPKVVGKTAVGIYSLEDDTLKWCVGGPGGKPATKFEAPKGSKHMFAVMKRVKK